MAGDKNEWDKLLTVIGQVDLGKVPNPAPDRDEEIEAVLTYVGQTHKKQKLNDWETDFYNDILFRHTMKQKITDRQFEKLLEIRRRVL